MHNSTLISFLRCKTNVRVFWNGCVDNFVIHEPLKWVLSNWFELTVVNDKSPKIIKLCVYIFPDIILRYTLANSINILVILLIVAQIYHSV